MTDAIDKVRAAALALPGSEERMIDGRPTFLVGGEAFASMAGDTLFVRQAEGEAFDTIGAVPSSDWAWIEDRIAASWEYVAPQGLAEAGGR